MERTLAQYKYCRNIFIRGSITVFEYLKGIPHKERIHLFQTEFQNLLLEVPIYLGSNLQILLKHLVKI